MASERVLNGVTEVSPGASPEEAAVIAVAIRRYLSDRHRHTRQVSRPSAWTRAARQEALRDEFPERHLPFGSI